MDFWELCRIAVRRWVIAVPVLVLGLAGAGVVTSVAPSKYTAVGSFLIVSTADPDLQEKNPLSSSGGRTVSDFVAAASQGADVLAAVDDAGNSTDFEVATGNSGVVAITVNSDRESIASATVVQVTTLLTQQLERQQRLLGAPAASWMRVQNVTPVPTVTESRADAVTYGALTAVLSLLIALASAMAADSWGQRRARRSLAIGSDALTPVERAKLLQDRLAIVQERAALLDERQSLLERYVVQAEESAVRAGSLRHASRSGARWLGKDRPPGDGPAQPTPAPEAPSDGLLALSPGQPAAPPASSPPVAPPVAPHPPFGVGPGGPNGQAPVPPPSPTPAPSQGGAPVAWPAGSPLASVTSWPAPAAKTPPVPEVTWTGLIKFPSLNQSAPGPTVGQAQANGASPAVDARPGDTAKKAGWQGREGEPAGAGPQPQVGGAQQPPAVQQPPAAGGSRMTPVFPRSPAGARPPVVPQPVAPPPASSQHAGVKDAGRGPLGGRGSDASPPSGSLFVVSHSKGATSGRGQGQAFGALNGHTNSNWFIRTQGPDPQRQEEQDPSRSEGEPE